MKRFLVCIVICLFLLVGCSTKEEDEKYAYLEYKSELEKKDSFNDEAPFNAYFNINRDKNDSEIVNYSIVIDNPTTDLYNVRALLIHDYMNEDVFPSVGIFDKPVNLKSNSSDSIKLSGNIHSISDISDVNFRLYLEYEDSDNNKTQLFYKVKRG